MQFLISTISWLVSNMLEIAKKIPGYRLINNEIREQRFNYWSSTLNPEWSESELRMHLEVIIRQAVNPDGIPF